MFLEQTGPSGQRKGWIEVICGSMFSGKTEELIRRLKRSAFAKQSFELFKPVLDKRYDAVNVVSHDKNTIRSTPVATSEHIFPLAEGKQVIGIDEAQFFDLSLPSVCTQLANKGTRIIVAGLDMDFKGRPFGPMPALMAIAEYVTKVHAICMKCGSLATNSHRMNTGDELVQLGEVDDYQPLCRSCFYKYVDPDLQAFNANSTGED